MMETGTPDANKSENSFEWDEKSQLYFHASSGFYHDPSAGWYYSCRDGLYYKFENGDYVLLGSREHNENEDANEAYEDITALAETTLHDPGEAECSNSLNIENTPPPSEWLEDTLISLYLSGYSNSIVDDGNVVRMSLETELGIDNPKFSADGDDDTFELEEGEWIPDESHDEGYSWEEENWRAQYGQVIQHEEELVPDFPVVDLWDWELTKLTKKKENTQIARLIGRLMRRTTKLHPSMPTGGSLFKTAPICEVHLDLVRVTTGQIYKLRSPSGRYLASLPTYDSSNPTKDWGFPPLSFTNQMPLLQKSSGHDETKTEGTPVYSESSLLLNQHSASKKHRGSAYRDRAAERRALHGGYGLAPGQKNLEGDETNGPSVSVCLSTEEAAAEALTMSFGAGSYARRMLENMGWKEGEGLGSSTKGLVEPLRAVGNKGSAGLGWALGRKHY